MNKKIRGLIAFSLVTANMLFTGGSNSFFTTAAYASSDDADEIYELDIEDSDGNSIDLYSDDDYEDEVDDDLDEGDTYYAESDTSKISIDTDDVDDDYVRIFANDSEYELGDKIKLKDGTNTIKIRVYEDEYDEDDSYSSSDYNQYTLKVEYDSDDDDDSEELTELDLENSDGDTLDLYYDSDYEDEVDDDLDEDDTYYAESDTSKITINNDDVDDEYVRIIYDSDVYELGDSIKLKDGTNTIKVRVYDEEYDEDETYSSSDYTQFTLKVKYDGDSEEDSDDASSDDEDLSDTSVNSTDTSLNESSITQTITTAPTADTIQSTDYVTSTASVSNNGWKYINNSWYYYYSDGTMASGWILSGGSWYYLDSTGKMLTGWFKDQDGSWYYLYESGAMAADTTIDGYKVGPSGAWIK